MTPRCTRNGQGHRPVAIISRLAIPYRKCNCMTTHQVDFGLVAHVSYDLFLVKSGIHRVRLRGTTVNDYVFRAWHVRVGPTCAMQRSRSYRRRPIINVLSGPSVRLCIVRSPEVTWTIVLGEYRRIQSDQMERTYEL